MGFDLKHQQEQQSLQRDGIHNLEILSPSNIEDSCSLPISLKYLFCIEFAKISIGMLLFIIGKKESSPQKVRTPPSLHSCCCILNYNIKTYLSIATPIRRAEHKHKHGFWAKKENRKQFLLEFAEKMGFDPKVAENWRNQRAHINANNVRFSFPPPPFPELPRN